MWATGYKDDTKWVAVPGVKAADGAFVHHRGVSSVPGLYSIGRSWQWTRGSALLHGVGNDAAYLMGRIAAYLDRWPAERTRAPGLASAREEGQAEMLNNT